MLNLLTSPSTRRTLRGLLGNLIETAADAVRSIAPTETPADIEPTEAPDPTDVLDADDMPSVEDIERAAKEYDQAADLARRADRGKRAAKRILGRLPSGIYGRYKIWRKPTARQTPDLPAIQKIFKAHGLGDVPMRATAPSLQVELLDTVPADTEQLAGVAA